MSVVTIGGIPVFNALISDEECGMVRISLVDDPAVMSNFQQFAVKKMQMYAVQDEEKRLVRGVVMRADFPIYRADEQMGEYYLMYSTAEIRKMAEKYLSESRQNNIDLNHNGREVEGVEMVQFFIKESGKGISPEGFDDIADGSLFAEFHIIDDSIWEEIKAGTYKGFSLEGIFTCEPSQDLNEVKEAVDTLDGKFSRTIQNIFKQKAMSKLSKLKAELAKWLVQFGSVTTDKGILGWDGDEDIKVGDACYLIGEAGEQLPIEDGDYSLEDGTIYRIAEGKLAEIVEKVQEAPAPVAEEAPAPVAEEAPAAEEEKKERKKCGRVVTDAAELIWEGEEDLKAGDEVFVEGEGGELVAAPDGDYKTEDGKVIKVAEGKVSEIVDAEAEVDPVEELREQMAKLQSENDELRKQVETLSTQPAAEPAHAEVTTSGEIRQTGNRRLDNLSRILRAGK